MHIAVTGASGFVGPRLIATLARAGHTGYAISRRELSGLPAGWIWLSRARALDEEISPFTGGNVPEWLVHLEVKQHVDSPSDADRKEFHAVNVDGTRRWLDWCARSGVGGFVFFSTIKAVGESLEIQDEAATSSPSTPYGASKREAEGFVSGWAAAGNSRRALILRPAVIYGPGNRANVFSMVRAIDRGIFFLVGRNGNVKSLVAIANVAAAVAHLVTHTQSRVEVFYIVDRASYPVREIAAMVTANLGGSSPLRSIPRSLAWVAAEFGEALRRVTGRNLPLTRSRLKALNETTHFSGQKLINTGFVHPQTTDEGLREMVEWYQDSKTQ